MTKEETPCLCRLEYALEGGPAIGVSDAPRFYAWLLAQLPAPDAEWFHENGGQFVSQHIRKEYATGKTVWSVSIMTKEANAAFLPFLGEELTVRLHPETLTAVLIRKDSFEAPLDFINYAKDHTVKRVAEVSLLSPLAFHQRGQCVIYPEARLLLQSLINRWNTVFPEYPLDDEDAMRALENGVMIRDYQLRTVRFALKGNKIPGCLGKLYLQSRLPEPLFEIWNLLLWFGAFSGAGIKTTLGMGALCFQTVRADTHPS